MLLLLLACSTAPDAASPPAGAPPAGAPARPGPPPAGGLHPPGAGGPQGNLEIPVDDPLWSQLNGLLAEPHGYGEANWDDVRMRVAGHLAVLGRDRARLAVAREDWAGCAAAYTDSATRLDALKLSGSTGPPIRTALATAARRDAALCGALAGGPPPGVPGGTVAPLRARWVGLVVRARAGERVIEEAEALAADAAKVQPPSGLDLDAFADFEARHLLRVRLVEAWADAVSPFSPTEPFDYWTAAEVPRQAAGLATAAAALAAGKTLDPRAADTLPPAEAPPWTADELGSLVTGDSLVDTLGFAGPRAIGTLAKLGNKDPEHRPWLEETAAALQAAPPATVPALVAERAAQLDAKPGGIRYYAIKQLRNAAVRHLAREGHYAEALTVLAGNQPLHAQDWACPDRAAILIAMQGRLELLAGLPTTGATLDRGLAEADSFLAHVARMELERPVPPGPPGPPR